MAYGETVDWIELILTFVRRTFGHQTELPVTSAKAIAEKWVAVSKCDNNLGVLYTKDASGPTEKHPLALRYTASGQLAGWNSFNFIRFDLKSFLIHSLGVQATVFGSNSFGDAAQKNLIDRGFWKPTANATKAWHMDVSFRAPETMCSSSTTLDELVGDRVVINQDTIKRSIPLTVKDAVAQSWTSGSCMAVRL